MKYYSKICSRILKNIQNFNTHHYIVLETNQNPTETIQKQWWTGWNPKKTSDNWLKLARTEQKLVQLEYLNGVICIHI